MKRKGQHQTPPVPLGTIGPTKPKRAVEPRPAPPPVATALPSIGYSAAMVNPYKQGAPSQATALPPWKLPPQPTPPTAPARTFAAAAAAPAKPVPPAPSSVRPPSGTLVSSNGQWPPALRTFVDRCFARCRSDRERDQMEVLLKQRIQGSMREGTLYTHNWSSEPLLGLTDLGKDRPPPSGPISAPAAKPPSPRKHALAKREERARRFHSDAPDATDRRVAEAQAKRARQSALLAMAEEGIDWDEFTIIGTCEKIEKRYLRLTSAPDPSTVRPLPVLKQTLEWLKARWRESGDYNYICDQFKSLRQDLTVREGECWRWGEPNNPLCFWV